MINKEEVIAFAKLENERMGPSGTIGEFSKSLVKKFGITEKEARSILMELIAGNLAKGYLNS